MIAGPSVPGAGELRYQPGLESGSSSDGTSTVPSAFRPSSISGELIPMAGTESAVGAAAGSTGPVGGAAAGAAVSEAGGSTAGGAAEGDDGSAEAEGTGDEVVGDCDDDVVDDADGAATGAALWPAPQAVSARSTAPRIPARRVRTEDTGPQSCSLRRRREEMVAAPATASSPAAPMAIPVWLPVPEIAVEPPPVSAAPSGTAAICIGSYLPHSAGSVASAGRLASSSLAPST